MPAQIIDGKIIAQQVRDEVAIETAQLREQGLIPGLAVVLVGEDPASALYVSNKEKTAKELGMYSIQHHLPAHTSEADLLALIDALNADEKIHGILVQAPLPKQINSDVVFRHILPEKDVDGFHPESVGRLWLGQEALVACTPVGVMVMLEKMGVDPAGKHAVICGRSNIVGKPMAALLMKKHATITVCHSKTPDLKETCRRGDILIAAMGKLQMLNAEYIKPGAVVIDVGINPVPGFKSKVRGDVDFDSAALVASMITPVPGGVGPMTIAMLMSNTVKAAKAQWNTAASI